MPEYHLHTLNMYRKIYLKIHICDLEKELRISYYREGILVLFFLDQIIRNKKIMFPSFTPEGPFVPSPGVAALHSADFPFIVCREAGAWQMCV